MNGKEVFDVVESVSPVCPHVQHVQRTRTAGMPTARRRLNKGAGFTHHGSSANGYNPWGGDSAAGGGQERTQRDELLNPV